MLRRPVPLVLAVLLACGPGKGGDTDSATATTTASTGTDPGTGGATIAPTTGSVSCDMFKYPDQVGPPVAITVENQGTQPMWVAAGGCGGFPHVDVVDGDTVLQPIGGDCSPTSCHEFLGLDDCSLGCNDCGTAQFARIEPGGSVVVNWQGTHGITAQVPVECAPDDTCRRDCLLVTPAAPGAYELRIQAFRGCDGACTCDAPGVEWCGIYDVLTPSDPVTFNAPLNYPDTTAVTIALTDP